MSEILKHNPTQPEVKAIRSWLEQEIVGKGICPPLVRLFQHYRDSDGTVSWDQLSGVVDIESYFRLSPYKPDLLLHKVSDSYLRFITEATQGNGPLTKIFILPEFRTNPDYDKFVDDMKKTAFARLVLSPDGQTIARSAFRQSAEAQRISQTIVARILNSGRDGEIQAAANVIEGTFRPAIFYGKTITDKDISDLPDTRGPKERYKMLSRAPYYVIQVANSIGGMDLSGNLNRQRIYSRNTRLASETDIMDYEIKMRRFRSTARETKED